MTTPRWRALLAIIGLPLFTAAAGHALEPIRNLALHRYVRRPGPEGDYHLLKPLEYHASTSELVQILEKGHYGVTLNAEEWDRLVTWIDLNATCFGTWSDRLGREALAGQHARRLDLRRRFAGVSDDPEVALGDPESPLNREWLESGSTRRTHVPVVPPRPSPAAPSSRKPPAEVEGWPFAAQPSSDRLTVSLGDDVTLEFVRIPAGRFVMGADNGFVDESPRRVVEIDRPFHMSTIEVSNEVYARFNPDHDARFIDLPGMELPRQGLPANELRQPVARGTWEEATAFRRWLSEKTGDSCTLPTEEQWEWACRAGTDTPFFYGDVDTDFSKDANFADKSIIGLSYTRYGRAIEDFIPNKGDREHDKDKSEGTTDGGGTGGQPP